MKDPDRDTFERLAKGALRMRQQGTTPEAILNHYMVNLVPHAKCGPRTGEQIVRFAVLWAFSGMPHVVVDHRLAASLMATSIPEEFADQVTLPWHDFIATIPAGLLDEYECSVMVQGNTKNPSVRLVFHDRRELEDAHGQQWNICQPWSMYASASTEKMRAGAVADGMRLPDSRDDKRRDFYAQCVCRFVFGVCAEMANRSAVGDAHARSKRQKNGRDSAEPQMWTYRLTRPVRIDVRAHLREYVGGGRCGLTTQHLRRGHWRHQPYGPRSSLRKYIHVEPCWVGSEDAPIAVRSHRLEGTGSTP